MVDKLEICPACGALPCDWTENPFATPANSEQVERIYVRWSDDGQHIRKWSRTPFDAGAPFDATPTEDTRERVKVLEEALEAILEGEVPRPVGKPWRADCKPSKHDRCVHDFWMYEDCSACIEAFARTALGNKEERL